MIEILFQRETIAHCAHFIKFSNLLISSNHLVATLQFNLSNFSSCVPNGCTRNENLTVCLFTGTSDSLQMTSPVPTLGSKEISKAEARQGVTHLPGTDAVRPVQDSLCSNMQVTSPGAALLIKQTDGSTAQQKASK